ncbi:DegT/DnrJ/EryC1/StrS family aminotransferase [Leifsonia sp. LS-T14]|uniref:DegT/DnrJ/EryC1/StrS family aminotransferase n=1 Tax=unclassified Leifsonia TaxID=2663824 RepID=UPI0035A5E8F3
MSYDVPFIRPLFPSGDAIAADLDRIVASNWFTNFGPIEREFAQAVADFVGEGHQAVTFSNATLGLLAAVQAVAGRGDGSRSVIVPSFTFAAGPQAIVWAGHRPLFIDIEPSSLQPSLEEASAAIDANPGRIAAILLCNTFGIGNPRIAEWEELSARSGIPLIIDSAAGFGSRYTPERRVGDAGVCEVFSFHATKPFAIGEGGAVVTRDHELAERLKSFSNFGFEPGSGATQLGLNGKLQEFNAALGLRQLADFDAAVRSRQEVLSELQSRLPTGLFRAPDNIGASSVCFGSFLLPTEALRDRALARLAAGGVEARSYYSPAVHTQPYFAEGESAGPLDVTADVGRRIVSLPIHQEMRRADIDRVVESLQTLETDR